VGCDVNAERGRYVLAFLDAQVTMNLREAI
jgi:hypothetical protein